MPYHVPEPEPLRTDIDPTGEMWLTGTALLCLGLPFAVSYMFRMSEEGIMVFLCSVSLAAVLATFSIFFCIAGLRHWRVLPRRVTATLAVCLGVSLGVLVAPVAVLVLLGG